VEGEYFLIDGTYIDGVFIDNNFTGEGLIKYSNGNEYTGQYKNFKPHGEGKIFLKKGASY